MTAPSIDAVSGLVDYDAGLLNDWGGGNVEWWQDYLRAEIGRANEFWRVQAESALEAQARELAEARVFRINATSKMRAMKARIAALEDAVRVKDEALRPFAGAARETDDGTRDDRNLRSHSAANLITAADLRRARTALSNGEPHDR